MFYQRFDEWLAHNKKEPQSDKPPPPPETEIDNEIKVTAPWKEVTFAFLIVLLLPLLIWYLIDQKNELLKPASPSVCRQILVPRLTGVPVQQGKRRLREAGVEIINETSQSSERIDSGRIITTQPAGGTCISRKQSIEITVSSGRRDLVEDLLILGGTVVDESGRALNGAHVMLADERWRQFYNLTDKPDSGEFISLDENASMMAFTVLSEYSSSRFASGSQIESASAIPPEIAETLTASIKATDRTDSFGNFLMRTNSQPGLELIIARGGYFAVVYFDLPSQAGALTLQVRLTRENKQWWRDLQTNFTTIRMFLFLIPIILSIVWLMWRRKRRQLVLERKSAKDVDSVALNIAEPVHKLFANAEFVSARIEAYRHQRIGSGDLDEAATVKTTIEQMGYFTPVYKSRLQVPTYLALIDKAGFKDQQAKLIDEFLNHLEMGGVHIERYYFNQDPRICAPASQARVNQKPLKDLAARYANNRLLVFTDGRGMTHPVTGRLANWTTVFESWQERAVLTPLSPYYWGSCEIELATSGFRVNHASAAGLHLFAQSLNDENTSSVQTKEWQPKYPELLNADPGRWLEPNPPLFEDVNELLLQLRRYLGPDGYRWLCSLAVYPTLDWHLTLYLGLELKSDNGTSLLDDGSLLSLVRLTWLREGNIPDWLRTMLIKDLSKADEETIRNFLWNLLRDPLENAESKFTLDIAERRRPVKKPGYKAWYRALLRAEPDDSLLCDHVFVNFLLDKPRTSIQLAAPSTWRNLVFEKGIHTLGLRNGAGLTLGITLGVGLALTSTYAVQFLKPLALSESLSAVNRDNWSEYLQESLPQSSDEGGDKPVQQTSEDQDSALEQVIVTGRKVKTGETNTNFVSPRETQDIQRLLNEIGYPLNPDGLAGGRTHNAVVQFQDDFGFEVNGNLTQQLIEQLETINSIDRRVRKIVLEQLAVNEEVTMYASFVDDLGADSLDLVELVMALEEEFNTEIPDSEAELITTVFDATRHISRRVLANTEGSY